MQRVKWERHTPVGEINKIGRPWDSSASSSSSTSDRSEIAPQFNHRNQSSGENGKDSANLLWGRIGSQPAKTDAESSENKAAISVLQEDAEWWQKNLIDPKTGKTADEKVLYDAKGEDRGVCRNALLGRSCPRGKDCPFSHPVQPTARTKIGKDLCLGIFRMSLRYNLDIGETALVQILDFVSPTLITVWVLQENAPLSSLHRQPVSFMPLDPKPTFYPDVFLDFLNEMTQFYGNNLHDNISYRSVRDVSDAFVAVRQVYDGQGRWFRGLTVDSNDTSETGRPAVRIRLMDFGKEVQVHQVQLLRRLDHKFMKLPWFAFTIGLGGLTFPPDSTAYTSAAGWFRERLCGSLAYVEVLEHDDIEDRPLVELILPAEQMEHYSFNGEVLSRGFAVRRSLQNPVYRFDHDEADDEDDEALDQEPWIVPG